MVRFRFIFLFAGSQHIVRVIESAECPERVDYYYYCRLNMTVGQRFCYFAILVLVRGMDQAIGKLFLSDINIS